MKRRKVLSFLIRSYYVGLSTFSFSSYLALFLKWLELILGLFRRN